jgi:hypothetical protein
MGDIDPVGIAYTILVVAWMMLFVPAYVIAKRRPIAAVGLIAAIWAAGGVFTYAYGDLFLDEAVGVGFIAVLWAGLGAVAGYFTTRNRTRSST